MSVIYVAKKGDKKYENIQEYISEYSTDNYVDIRFNKSIKDTILVQFLNTFSEDDFSRKTKKLEYVGLPRIYCEIAYYLDLELSKYKNSEEFNELLREEITKIDLKIKEKLSEIIFKNDKVSNELQDKIEKYAKYINLDLILENTKKTMNESKVCIINGIDATPLYFAILNSNFMKNVILLYLHPQTTNNRWGMKYLGSENDRYSGFYNYLMGHFKEPRPVEIQKLDLLLKFCKQYYLDSKGSKALVERVLLFIAKYLDYNIEKFRTNKDTLIIRSLVAILLKKEPAYKIKTDEKTLVNEKIYELEKKWGKSTIENPYIELRARQLVQHNKKALNVYKRFQKNIGILDNQKLHIYKIICDTYNDEIDNLELEWEQQQALKELTYYYDHRLKNDNREKVFDDIEQMMNPNLSCKESDSENIYLVNDFVLLCCISLYYHALYQVPIRRCSLCNRYYIPKQNRKKEENYCHRIYPRQKTIGKKLTCSEYNSHVLSVKNKSEDEILNRLVKQINNLRSSLCQGINKREHIRESVETVNFFQKILTVIKAEAKKNSPLSDNNVSVKAGDAAKRLYDKLSKLDKADMPEIERKIKEDNIFDSEAEITSEEVFYYVTELESLVEKKILSKNKKNKESDLYR